MGGAIFSDAGALIVTNSTLSANFAKGGAPGTGGSGVLGPTAGQGSGGGIFARNAMVTINYVTLNNNSVTDGAGATVASGGGSLYLLGDGQMATRGDPTNVSFGVTNTILANTPGGASDAFVNTINGGTTSPGTNQANLVRVNGSTPGPDANDLPGVTQTGDPKLGPLTLNSPGNTPTHALLPGSPAIDQGVPIGGITTDQRGAPRPVRYSPAIPLPMGGDGSDIGAYEASPLNFNLCLQDGGTGDFLQWNSTTGDYLFTHCGTNGFTLAGTGSARLANNTQSLSDNKPDRRISAGYLVNQLTGSATVIVIRAAGLTQTYHINQTNIHPTCVCRGG
jgi:hypothetical protein